MERETDNLRDREKEEGREKHYLRHFATLMYISKSFVAVLTGITLFKLFCNLLCLFFLKNSSQ